MISVNKTHYQVSETETGTTLTTTQGVTHVIQNKTSSTQWSKSAEHFFTHSRAAGTPRPASSYRGARRNAFKGLVWPGCRTGVQGRPMVRINRSRNLPRALTYQMARDIAHQHCVPQHESVR